MGLAWFITDHYDIDNNRTVESRLSLRLSLRFSLTGLDLGLMQAELLETPAGLDALPAMTIDPVQAAPSTLALFSTFTLTVCRLRAEGGGRSPKSFKNKITFPLVFFMTIVFSCEDDVDFTGRTQMLILYLVGM